MVQKTPLTTADSNGERWPQTKEWESLWKDERARNASLFELPKGTQPHLAKFKKKKKITKDVK